MLTDKKTKQKFKSKKLVFFQTKKMPGNQNAGGRHKKLPMKSNAIDKLALKNMTKFDRFLDHTIYQCKICLEARPKKTKIRKNSKKHSLTMCVSTV